MLLDWLVADLLRVDKLGRAELTSNIELGSVDVDADDAAGTSLFAAHDDG